GRGLSLSRHQRRHARLRHRPPQRRLPRHRPRRADAHRHRHRRAFGSAQKLIGGDRLPRNRRMTFRNDIEITPELVASHGLKPEEFDKIVALIGRQPTYTELGIFSAMWNEHCSYKSSKKWLRTLPTEGPRVIQGPGENAGVVDI